MKLKKFRIIIAALCLIILTSLSKEIIAAQTWTQIYSGDEEIGFLYDGRNTYLENVHFYVKVDDNKRIGLSYNATYLAFNMFGQEEYPTSSGTNWGLRLTEENGGPWEYKVESEHEIGMTISRFTTVPVRIYRRSSNKHPTVIKTELVKGKDEWIR